MYDATRPVVVLIVLLVAGADRVFGEEPRSASSALADIGSTLSSFEKSLLDRRWRFYLWESTVSERQARRASDALSSVGNGVVDSPAEWQEFERACADLMRHVQVDKPALNWCIDLAITSERVLESRARRDKSRGWPLKGREGGQPYQRLFLSEGGEAWYVPLGHTDAVGNALLLQNELPITRFDLSYVLRPIPLASVVLGEDNLFNWSVSRGNGRSLIVSHPRHPIEFHLGISGKGQLLKTLSFTDGESEYSHDRITIKYGVYGDILFPALVVRERGLKSQAKSGTVITVAQTESLRALLPAETPVRLELPEGGAVKIGRGLLAPVYNTLFMSQWPENIRGLFRIGPFPWKNGPPFIKKRQTPPPRAQPADVDSGWRVVGVCIVALVALWAWMMKRRGLQRAISPLVACVLCLGACSQTEPVAVQSREINLGTIKPTADENGRETFKHTFEWTNHDPDAWDIRKILRSCTCIEAQVSSRHVAPGETIRVTFRADLSGRTGQLSLSSTLVGSKPGKRLTFVVRGDIQRGMTVAPSNLVIAALRCGQVKRVSATIVGRGVLRIRSDNSSPAWLQGVRVVAIDSAIPKGQVKELHCILGPFASVGSYQHQVVVEREGPDGRESLVVPITVRSTAPVTVEPALVRGAQTSARVTIKHSGSVTDDPMPVIEHRPFGVLSTAKVISAAEVIVTIKWERVASAVGAVKVRVWGHLVTIPFNRPVTDAQ